LKNILIAVNSFKECADAVTASEFFNKYLDKSLFNVIQKPISDGGDGFLEVCEFNFGLEILTYQITTPYDESFISCRVGLDRSNKTLYIESAEVLGLRKIPAGKRHPLLLSSKGLGDLLLIIMKDIEQNRYDVNKVIIGIGGTGTMDMGLGACSRLGLKLYDNYGPGLKVVPENFYNIAKIEFQPDNFPFEIEIVLDVDNPLLGKEGGVIYGKQKGASNAELKVIELGWNKVANILNKNELNDTTKELYGAGGGLSLGLNLIKKCTHKKAFDFISDQLRIGENISTIDMILTGEGSFDEQSLMGKGAGAIISMFEKENIPIILCSGKIDNKISEQLSMNVFPIELGRYYNTVEESIENFEESIKFACNEIAGMTDILTKIS
jgi:glycerate 2-kinase